MKRWLNSPWVIAALCAAATFFVVQALFDWKGKNRRVADPAMTTEIGDGQDREHEVIEPLGSVDEALAQLGNPENPPDPFGFAPIAPMVMATPAVPEQVETLRLTAIWGQGPVMLLLINDRVCEVGDRIGQIAIESATMDGAWLSHRQGRDFLPFGEVFSLVTPANESGANNSNYDEI